jgi:hypothetical protein
MSEQNDLRPNMPNVQPPLTDGPSDREAKWLAGVFRLLLLAIKGALCGGHCLVRTPLSGSPQNASAPVDRSRRRPRREERAGRARVSGRWRSVCRAGLGLELLRNHAILGDDVGPEPAIIVPRVEPHLSRLCVVCCPDRAQHHPLALGEAQLPRRDRGKAGLPHGRLGSADNSSGLLIIHAITEYYGWFTPCHVQEYSDPQVSFRSRCVARPLPGS